jgi:hypothetical protein
MQSWDIVGYTFLADTYCPECVCEAILTDYYSGDEEQADRMNDVSSVFESAEWNLNRFAEILGINRQDETTYDSDDFPKVIFADSVEDDICGKCHESL